MEGSSDDVVVAMIRGQNVGIVVKGRHKKVLAAAKMQHYPKGFIYFATYLYAATSC